MTYRILDSTTVMDYVRQHPKARDVLDVNAKLESAEIGDGNLNFVFRVFEKTNHARSILVKQAVPYLRVAGESWPLSSARAGFEAQALRMEYRFAPEFVPEPYWFDQAMAINAMQDLRQHQVIRKPMVNRVRFSNLGATIGRFCAATLFGTSDFGLEAKTKKALQAQFANAELCEITEDLILTEPFEPVLLEGKTNRNRFDPGVSDALEQLQDDLEVRANVARLKHRFMTCAQALLHGDLHAGSIMASNPDQHGVADIRVIDPEFAFFGPIGFDVGSFVANLFLNASAQHGHAIDLEAQSEYRRYLFGQARAFWETFEEGFRQRFKAANSVSWRGDAFQDAFMLEVLRDTAGYAGCEMIRRSVGFAHVLDVDSIADDTKRAEALQMNLQAGERLIRSHQVISGFAEIVGIVRSVIDS
jgi:5-methylthioribose kinase